MSASTQVRRGALTVAVVLPFLGACASLIGLEEAEVDGSTGAESTGALTSGTISSGSQSTGTEGAATSSGSESGAPSSGTAVATATAASTSSGGGAGGDGGAGGESNGGGGGAGGDVLEAVIALDAGFVGTRLLGNLPDVADVLVLGERSGPTGSSCDEDPPPGGNSQVLVLRYAENADCSPQLQIDGIDVHSRSFHLNGQPSLAVGGTFEGDELYVEGEPLALGTKVPAGTFALRVNGQATVTHLAVPASGEIDPAPDPRGSFALPMSGGLLFISHFGAVSGANEECAIDGGVGVASFQGTASLDSCSIAVPRAAAAVDAADGPGGGLVTYVDNAAIFVARADAAAGVALRIGDRPSNAPQVPFRTTFVPDGGYYLVSGVSPAAGCGGAPSDGPFLARIDTVDAMPTCTSFWHPNFGDIDIVLAGTGIEEHALAAARFTGEESAWVLVDLPVRGDDFGDPTPVSFCMGCEIVDLAISSGVVWVLGRVADDVDEPSIRELPLPPELESHFLFRAPYEFLFPEAD